MPIWNGSSGGGGSGSDGDDGSDAAGTYNVNCLVDFSETAFVDLKALGDVPQVVGVVSGLVVPAAIENGVTITPLNSQQAWCDLHTCGPQGLRTRIVTSTTGKLVYDRFGLSQFNLDRSKPFDLWFLINTAFRTFTTDGTSATVTLSSNAANSFMSAQIDATDNATYGSLLPRSIVYGKYVATYDTAIAANARSDASNMLHAVQAVRFGTWDVELASRDSDAGDFPEVTPNDSLASFHRRGRASIAAASSSSNLIFPNDDDELSTYLQAVENAEISYLKMRVIQRG